MGAKRSFYGIEGRARVLCALPGTCKQVAERIGTFPHVVARIMIDMHRLGVVYRAAIVYQGPTRRETGVWNFGRGTDVTLTDERPSTRAPRASAIALATLLRELWAGPRTVRQLVHATGMNGGTVRRVLVLLKASRRVYVARWISWEAIHSRPNAPTAAFALGRNMPDAERPRPTSRWGRIQTERSAA